MSQADSVQPPRLAVWFVTLFAPAERAESICGDLLEEFSQLATQSGVASARRWFWRQTVRTVVHLVVAGIRGAPLMHAATAVTGFFLLVLGLRFVVPAVEALLEAFHVYEYLAEIAGDVASVEVGAEYFSWIMSGALIGRLLLGTLVGGLVTVATKGRSLTAAIALGLLVSALGIANSLLLLANTHSIRIGFFWTVPTVFVHSIAVVLGGVLVRTLGHRASLRPSAT